MRRRSLRPARRLLVVAGVILVLAGLSDLAGLWWPGQGASLRWGWGLSLAVLMLLAVWDYWQLRRLPQCRLRREVPANLPLGHRAWLELELEHDFARPLRLQLVEWLPPALEVATDTFDLQLAPGQPARLRYPLTPRARGPQCIAGCDLVYRSPLGFWRISVHLPEVTALRVYPDFAAIASDLRPSTEDHSALSGVRRQQRRGLGTDFHQLREYRLGDSLRQIDWKATSRRRELISREYQEERDQQVVVLLDLGRRMRAADADWTHLDDAINGVVLLGYSALRQGDALGLMTFGGEQRWLAPRKGMGTINAVLNQLYDLQPTLRASDYSGAAQWLMERLRKRALVVLVTNTRDEDQEDLMAAVRLLGRRHLVMLANLREPQLRQAIIRPVETLEQGLRYAGATDFLLRREDIQRHLTAAGVLLVDAMPSDLPQRLSSAYYAVKRSGRL